MYYLRRQAPHKPARLSNTRSTVVRPPDRSPQDPLGLLRAIRTALHPSGSYVCAEVNGGATLAENLNPFGALFYGVSMLFCMSVSLATGGPGLGSFGLPEQALTKLCTEAGFATVRRLPIDDPSNALYDVRP